MCKHTPRDGEIKSNKIWGTKDIGQAVLSPPPLSVSMLCSFRYDTDAICLEFVLLGLTMPT